MANPPTLIDGRSEQDLAQQVKELIKQYAPDWNDIDPSTQQPVNISAALINIFARYGSLIIQRLNRAPEKNFLAFLDMLGASLLPPQPARVPVTFLLAPGSISDTVVPPGTQVAAPPAEGEKDPVIFETERELVVTSAQMASLFARDPDRDRYADQTAILTAPAEWGVPLFEGSRSLDHILYVANDLFGLANLETLSLTLDLSSGFNTEPALIWEFWNGKEWETNVPVTDATNNLTQTGAGLQIKFGVVGTKLKAILPRTLNSITGTWIRCRLATPMAPPDQPARGMVDADHLPEIDSVSVAVTAGNLGLVPTSAFANQAPADLSKDFFPFGEKPRIGDTLYLASDEAFSQPGASLTFHVTLTSGNAPRSNTGATLTWEYWNGRIWLVLGTFTGNGTSTANPGSFTGTGNLTLTLPLDIQPTTINGIDSYWIRVRLSAGDYGKEASYRRTTTTPPGYEFIEATFAPPSINKITVDYALSKIATSDHIDLLTYNDFKYITPKEPFAPFQLTEDTDPSIFLGFTLPLNRDKFPNLTLSLYVRMIEHLYGEATVPISPERSLQMGDPGTEVTHTFDIINSTAQSVGFTVDILGTVWESNTNSAEISLSPGESKPVRISVAVPSNATVGSHDRGWLRLTSNTDPAIESDATFVTFSGSGFPASSPLRLTWEYWNGVRWGRLVLNDKTSALTSSGLVEFLPPADFTSRVEFGQERYWLRARWESGDYTFTPKMQTVYLNTTIAAQTITLTNETLGSSNGNQNQVFRTARAPVLNGQQVQVRETEIPAAEDLAKIEAEEGQAALSITRDSAGRPVEIWVRWHAVPDFYGSGPRDRHYVLDHLTGEIRFGDGVSGRIPPIGMGNIRISLYKTGGGARGNRPVGAIVQLKTTIPYLDKVINHEAAAGGSEPEVLNSLIERAPRSIRHRDRAVTIEDYEDLARLSTPEVARARCVPLYDLAADPDATRSVPGTVSVIIVPRATSPKPLASVELIERVQRYLDAHRIPTANVIIVGAEYVRVDVETEIALTSLEVASNVELAVQAALASFLHPLTGGLDRAGWDFGRQPHESDAYVLLESIPGVDHIRMLRLTPIPDRPNGDQTNRFLVYAGTITTALSFEEG
jgi:predicted phage baseplate assembly protein